MSISSLNLLKDIDVPRYISNWIIKYSLFYVSNFITYVN